MCRFLLLDPLLWSTTVNEFLLLLLLSGKKADCTISMSDNDLPALMTGKLNPQTVCASVFYRPAHISWHWKDIKRPHLICFTFRIYCIQYAVYLACGQLFIVFSFIFVTCFFSGLLPGETEDLWEHGHGYEAAEPAGYSRKGQAVRPSWANF